MDDAALLAAFRRARARGLTTARALGGYGYGNYESRKDADAACQALADTDLGAGAD